MNQFDISNWNEEFNNPPTRESLSKVPIFSGLRINDSIVFHSGYKTSASIESLNFQSRFLEIALKEFGLTKLYGLLLIPYPEFLLYPRVDKLLVQQSQKIIQDFILEEREPCKNNIEWMKEHFWVIDKEGIPVKRTKRPTLDSIPSSEIITEKSNNAVQTGYQENGNRNIQTIEVSGKQLILKTKLFIGDEGITISSKQLSNIPISSLFTIFSIRFVNVLKRRDEIKSLQDLLNTTSRDLLILRNCGVKSIEDAKSAILSLNLPSFSSKSAADETIRLSKPDYPFLQGRDIFDDPPTEDKLNTPLQRLEFPVRFQSFLACHNQITTVKELLEIPILSFSKNKNIGRITVSKVQEIIMEFLTSNNEGSSRQTITETSEDDNYSKRYDEIIVNRIISLLGERNSKVLLMRYGYETISKLTLEEIGAFFGITRERARQIIQSGEKRLSSYHRLIIFKELIQFVEAGPIVTTFNIIASKLIESNLWSPKNDQFLKSIIDQCISKYFGLFVEGDYILTVSPDVIRKRFKNILEEVNLIIQDSKERIEMDFVISRLKKTMELPESDINNLFNNVTISYLADKYKEFHVVEDGVYNEMLYQVRYGRYLKDVVHGSMKYLEEPVHFRQLANFIRANNERNRDIADLSVHCTLINSNFAHDVNRGIYALVESKIPKHVSTWNAIKSLFQEKGPLLEDEIYELLRMKYSSWSIQMAIENNRNKLVRIGNDMFDLKGEDK